VAGGGATKSRSGCKTSVCISPSPLRVTMTSPASTSKTPSVNRNASTPPVLMPSLESHVHRPSSGAPPRQTRIRPSARNRIESAFTKPFEDRSVSTVHRPKSGDAACATGSAFRTPPLTVAPVGPRRCGMDVRRSGSVEAAFSEPSSASVERSALVPVVSADGSPAVFGAAGVLIVPDCGVDVRVFAAADDADSSCL